MKTPKQWAQQIRNSLGNDLRADPVMVNGKSVLETCVEMIQLEVELEVLQKQINKMKEQA